MRYFILKEVFQEHLVVGYSNHQPNSLALQREDEPEKDLVLSMSDHKYLTSYQYHYLENLIPLFPTTVV